MSVNENDMSGKEDSMEDHIAKLRGLPWSTTKAEIVKFFADCKILNGDDGIHLTNSREGRPSGEAFVEFEDESDLTLALQKDKEHMGSRYIEVFKVNRAEMEWVVKREGAGSRSNDDGCVRLRGLPFGCSKEEIAQFFTGLAIVPNGITLLTDFTGRSSGEAFVQFSNKEVAEKALLKHREKIGHRYIEIFRSSKSEINSVVGFNDRRIPPLVGGPGMFNSRPGPYDRGDRYGGPGRFGPRGAPRNFKGANFSADYFDRPSPWNNGNDDYEEDSWGDNNFGSGRASGAHTVHMRGLPFRATQQDISEFFRPVIPMCIRLLQDDTGRASGEADVDFASHEDALRAMYKDKSNMQHRYIELFMNSEVGGAGGAGGRRRY